LYTILHKFSTGLNLQNGKEQPSFKWMGHCLIELNQI
jgi:hypothetical protein